MNSQVTHWLARDPDPKTRQELQQLIDTQQDAQIAERFQSRLEFGTAGLRGKVGCGPNRMNRLVIQETAAGLGHYLIAQLPDAKNRGVVIGYDGRPDSKQFAHDTASVLTSLGIKTYLTYQVAATPIVAFGVRHFNAAAAVVVTASHNPPEYNGFKVYWENGAQIIPPHDAGIAACIDQAAQQALPYLALEQAEQQGLLHWLRDEYYQTYRKTIGASPLLQHHTKPQALSLAYTAMHGVGANMAETLLADTGFTHVSSVKEQREPDGTFPTVNFPNPEEAGAMDMVMALAKKVGAQLACANDPDADRFAVAARKADGGYQMLTGDQVGSLFGHYLLSQTDARRQLVGNTIVSSSLLSKIAAAHGARYYQTLTGFKWLTNVAMQEQTEQHQFLFAYEEALGYTIGSTVWDKDGLSALVAFAQLAAELNAQGKTVWDQLEALYRQHGLHVNAQRSIALAPNSPPVGDKLRATPPTDIAGRKVLIVEDFKLARRTFADGKTETITLPTSDVLIYHLDGGARVIVRPSGTEPKLKCYYEVVTPFAAEEDFVSAQERADEQMSLLIAEHQTSL
ncbi:TPA: phospho-sugar mutase [Vibrio cholerae]|uniref:phospho-sugar mutase n=1 Tax=Vibrio cholerae TaxID=666 RepID=UPI0002C1656D|nr:phospho-sugar mutase [Vibrio cholerae]EIF5158716.1 phospho-sugar mutase [Vibrio cholerae]EMQ59720.1 phosphoglucomutase/phosphomannomutase, C-terminal domain protein [Vibrio cholerae O1 str. EM-1676A]GHZ33080.1 phosphomannomutase, putative [Vibrio cholerae]HAS4282352.1 phospho-sugar mutase [Vibrio cholerae]HAS4301565.1 phospho-sugar mutase [Vibrio cholerae]